MSDFIEVRVENLSQRVTSLEARVAGVECKALKSEAVAPSDDRLYTVLDQWPTAEALHADAELGRLVRRMPVDWELSCDSEGWMAGPEWTGGRAWASPEEALRAALAARDKSCGD